MLIVVRLESNTKLRYFALCHLLLLPNTPASNSCQRNRPHFFYTRPKHFFKRSWQKCWTLTEKESVQLRLIKVTNKTGRSFALLARDTNTSPQQLLLLAIISTHSTVLTNQVHFKSDPVIRYSAKSITCLHYYADGLLSLAPRSFPVVISTKVAFHV